MKNPFLYRFGMKSPFYDNETGTVFSMLSLFSPTQNTQNPESLVTTGQPTGSTDNTSK